MNTELHIITSSIIPNYNQKFNYKIYYDYDIAKILNIGLEYIDNKCHTIINDNIDITHIDFSRNINFNKYKYINKNKDIIKKNENNNI